MQQITSPKIKTPLSFYRTFPTIISFRCSLCKRALKGLFIEVKQKMKATAINPLGPDLPTNESSRPGQVSPNRPISPLLSGASQQFHLVPSLNGYGNYAYSIFFSPPTNAVKGKASFSSLFCWCVDGHFEQAFGCSRWQFLLHPRFTDCAVCSDRKVKNAKTRKCFLM